MKTCYVLRSEHCWGAVAMDLREFDVARGIDLIYAAGLRPEGWSNFLTHFDLP